LEIGRPGEAPIELSGEILHYGLLIRDYRPSALPFPQRR
jgi:hypothetical protein